MQELIEKLKEERSKLQVLNERVMVLTLDYAIADAEQMLEKEKEFMQKVYANAKATGEMDEAVRTFNNKEI